MALDTAAEGNVDWPLAYQQLWDRYLVLGEALDEERERVRDAEKWIVTLEDALDTIHRRVLSIAHDYGTLAETRQEANSLYRDMQEAIFAPMKARRAALATAGGEGATR